MTLEKPKVESPEIKGRRRRKVSDPTAEEMCRAVLSVWTERCTPGEVCRKLGVPWNVLNRWQDRAMEGMLLGLQPRVEEKGVGLSPRLALLLEKKCKEGAMKGLEPGQPLLQPLHGPFLALLLQQ